MNLQKRMGVMPSVLPPHVDKRKKRERKFVGRPLVPFLSISMLLSVCRRTGMEHVEGRCTGGRFNTTTSHCHHHVMITKKLPYLDYVFLGNYLSKYVILTEGGVGLDTGVGPQR